LLYIVVEIEGVYTNLMEHENYSFLYIGNTTPLST